MDEKELEKLIDEVLEASENYYKIIAEKFFKLNKESKDFLNKAYLTNESIKNKIDAFEVIYNKINNEI